MKKLIFLTLFLAYSLSSQTIQDYLKEAEQNNPMLKAKYTEYEQQLLNAPQVSATPDPNVNFGYFITHPYTKVGAQNFKLSIVQKLPWFGTLSDYEKESLELAETKRKDYNQKKDEIFYAIRMDFYNLYKVEEQKKYIQESLDLLNYIHPIVKTKVETNSSNLSDLLSLELMISELETKIELLVIESNPIKQDLKQLLNRKDDKEIIIPNDLEEKIDFAALKKQIDSNPSVQKLEILQKASQLRVNLAQSESNPVITLGLDYINVSKMPDMDVPNNGVDIFMPSVGISIPFFSGRYSAKEEQATAMIKQYQYEQENLVNNLNSQYESVIYNIKSDEEKVKLYDSQIEKTINIRELLFEEYSTKEGEDILEVTRTEEKIIEYKKLRLEALVSILNNKAQLIKIVGE